MQNWLKRPVLLPIRPLFPLQILLYSHSSQRQHLDDDVHQLLSLCYSLENFICYFDILFLHY